MYSSGASVQQRDPDLQTFPAAQALHVVMPPGFSFSIVSCLVARGLITVGMHLHTGGVKYLSSSTGDARRVECAVVLDTLNIAEEAFDTSIVVAQVMRG
jgi:hypothetical protein